MKTKNGANTNYGTFNPSLEFFSKAGSLFENRKSYYGEEATALDLFKSVWTTDKERAMKLLFWLRDPRGGAGNRSATRSILKWLSEEDGTILSKNISKVVEYGRFDDLISFVDTPLEDSALSFWAEEIKSNKTNLASKWAPRDNKKNKRVARKLASKMGLGKKEYRKHISKNSKVVETLMCDKNWKEIEYSKVPSVAITRYKNSYYKNDSERFSQWVQALKDPNSGEKVNSSVVFPHDLVRSLFHSGNLLDGFHSDLVDSQFDAMPNWFSSDLRILPIVDSSGSMGVPVAGSILARDVAFGLGFYASSRTSKEKNPFHKKFIPFSTEASFFDWSGKTFSQGFTDFHSDKKFGYIGTTNIISAFKLILDTAKFFKLSDDQIPNCLLIISDMQFDDGVSDMGLTAEQEIKKMYSDSGYSVPKIVYWNTAGYAGSPSTAFSDNTGLVSGFSPAILKSVFDGDDFSPMAIMERTLEKYKIDM